jgi:hypothetical protein
VARWNITLTVPFLPDVFTIFKDKKDKARELAILRMQIAEIYNFECE